MVEPKSKLPENKKKPDGVKNKKRREELWQTVCCCLCADEPTRKFLWNAMENYTLLVNRLIADVSDASDFEQWKGKGWVPEKEVTKLCQKLKLEKQFKGMPSRFYMSATSIVTDTFDAWIASQRQLSRKLNGKRQWLKAVEEDLELAQITDLSPEIIQKQAKVILLELSQAKEVLLELSQKENEEDTDKNQQEDGSSLSQKSLFSLLFDVYEMTEGYLNRRAIVHLLKNGGEVNEEPEDPEKLEKKLAIKRERIRRLEEQLASRLPKGRDPKGEQTVIFLKEATQLPEHPTCYPVLFLFDVFYHYALSSMPSIQYGIYLLQKTLIEAEIVESEFLTWQEAMTGQLHNAARIPNSLPYPLVFGSADDLYWSFELKERKQQDSQTEKSSEGSKARKRPSKRKRKKLKTRSEERICVCFKGLSDYVFRLYCDRRQLPVFQLFATDWQNWEKLDEEKKYSLGLFVLRSAKLIWQEDEQSLHKKGKSKQANSEKANVSTYQEAIPPWKTHRLYLHCSIDSELLTAEGTEKVRQRKMRETTRTLENAREKEQELLIQMSRSDLSEQEMQELEQQLTQKRRKILAYETSLMRLKNSPLRPSRLPHEGEPNITLGVSFCRQELVGVAVVNLQTQQVLEYYSIRKLLINQRVKKLRRNRSLFQLKLEQYRLVNRLRKLSRRNLVHRQKEQKQGQHFESKAESNLGQYLERLIAAKIAQVALKWKASSVVIPDLTGMREYIESAIQAKAKQLFPNHRELQKNYEKQFRIEGHRWSYRTLAEFIHSRTLSEGIAIKTGRQPTTGNLLNKALKIALSGHSLT